MRTESHLSATPLRPEREASCAAAPRVAVLRDDAAEPSDREIHPHHTEMSGPARVFGPDEVRRLSDEIIAGRVQLLLCRNLRSLIRCLWECQIQVEKWRGHGLRIELMDSPFPPGTDIWPVLLEATEAWLAAQRASQRRRVVAGVILTLLAVGACAVLMFLRPG